MKATVRKRFRGAQVTIEVDGRDIPELVSRIEALISKLNSRDIARAPGTRVEFERLFSERMLDR